MLTANKLVHKDMSFEYYENEIRKFYKYKGYRDLEYLLKSLDIVASYGSVVKCLEELEDLETGDDTDIIDNLKVHVGDCFRYLVRLAHLVDESIPSILLSSPRVDKTTEIKSFIHLHRLVLAYAESKDSIVPEYSIEDGVPLADHSSFLMFSKTDSEYVRGGSIDSVKIAIADRMMLIQVICLVFRFDLSEICSKHLYSNT